MRSPISGFESHFTLFGILPPNMMAYQQIIASTCGNNHHTAMVLSGTNPFLPQYNIPATCGFSRLAARCQRVDFSEN